MYHLSILRRHGRGVLFILVYVGLLLVPLCRCNRCNNSKADTNEPEPNPSSPFNPSPPGQAGLQKVVDITDSTNLTAFIGSISPGVSLADLGAAAKKFNVHAGSISQEPTGIIQDPAGSAIGSGTKPSGGGLSGAIYGKFTNLAPIPSITPGQSIFNSSEEADSKRILHTHGYKLSAAGGDLKEAVKLIKVSYLNAIKVFVSADNKVSDKGGKNTFNLCAVSAAIFGEPFTSKFDGKDHIDPSMTEVALALAIAEYLKGAPDGLDGKTLKLFYYGKDGDALVAKAKAVKNTLNRLS